MSETPVPQMRMETADDQAAEHDGERLVEARARFKAHPGRAVSAFSGAAALARSEPEQASTEVDDSDFVAGLQAAGLLRELSLSELERIQQGLPSAEGAARRIDLLEGYYSAAGDAVSALRRRATDRWFLHHAGDSIGAPQLMQRLLGVLPELSGAHLERVGSSTGTLVVRLGEHICALDEDTADHGMATVSVHEVVRGLNVLLERKGVRARLVGILGDGEREAYVGLPSLVNALSLVEADYLTATDAETLMSLTAW